MDQKQVVLSVFGTEFRSLWRDARAAGRGVDDACGCITFYVQRHYNSEAVSSVTTVRHAVVEWLLHNGRIIAK